MLSGKNLIRYFLLISTSLILVANFNFLAGKNDNKSTVNIINGNAIEINCEIFEYEPSNIKYNISKIFHLNNNIYIKVKEGELFLYKFLYRGKISPQDSIDIKSQYPFQNIYFIYYEDSGVKGVIQGTSNTGAVKIVNQIEGRISSEIFLRSKFDFNASDLCIGGLHNNKFKDSIQILFIFNKISIALLILLVSLLFFSRSKVKIFLIKLLYFIRHNYIRIFFFVLLCYYILIRFPEGVVAAKNLIIFLFLLIILNNLKFSVLGRYYYFFFLIFISIIVLLIGYNYEMISDLMTAVLFALIYNKYFTKNSLKNK